MTGRDLLKAAAVGALGAVKEDGLTRISKTKALANLGGVNALLVLLPGVLNKDPQAIGQFVVLLITWAGTLWGRGNGG